ncbi:DAK2 domain-containing protein [Sharpea azabuensis]|uniref:DAK2 domain-containing protein n=1 Tax=Sharpea azabuensis TaxID=322505 RepID=UPI0013DD3913|nr:DAK2 domain-containing protein [Sharpea azabuensis]
MKTIDGKMFRAMVETGANLLHNNHPEIDALNVFPVPDGDTGTNMSLTFTNGAAEVKKLESDNLGDVAKTLSKGLLMGARGNSGVILSQIFRGVAKSLKGKESADAVELAEAFASGAKVAYKAVMRPVEGTILTVIREASEAGSAYVKEDMEVEDWFSYFVKEANDALDRTPELLPVLKEVGVVDSGGAGLVVVLTGFMLALAGEEVVRVDVAAAQAAMKEAEEASKQKGYQDEGKAKAFTIDGFTHELERTPATDVNVTQKDDVVFVSLATERPGHTLNVGQRFGELAHITIVNFNEPDYKEPEAQEEKAAPAKETAIISVAAGVSGGQTMNPATEDIVKAVRKVNAKNVIILPNNSNIVMTAQQAATVLEDEINVIVIPSKTVPQGLAACMMYNTEAGLDENVNEMTSALEDVQTGQVTFAIKDTTIDGLEIKANNYMALCNKKIVACVPDKIDALKKALEGLVDDDSEVITLICGEDVTEEEKEAAQSYIEENFEDCELEMNDGGQPVYSFIIGVE